MEDFDYARDKVLMGAKREEVLTDEEKEKTAYHEAGHALIAWLTPGADRVHKVTIIPRGRALGVDSNVARQKTAEYVRARAAVIIWSSCWAVEPRRRLIYDETSAGRRKRSGARHQHGSTDGDPLGHE